MADVGPLRHAPAFWLSVDASASIQTGFIFGAILLHGVCYDFLFIAGQLYVDGESNERNRGAAHHGNGCDPKRLACKNARQVAERWGHRFYTSVR